jgi:thymidylate synthase (FAD)
MEVKLVNKELMAFELFKSARASRECYNSEHLSDSKMDFIGEKDKALLLKLADFKHFSPFEQAVLTFDIKRVSRALLQQLSRHRIQSLNVKSTRFTIHKMIKEYKYEDFDKYFYSTGDNFIDEMNKKNVALTIAKLRQYEAETGIKLPNDKVKYLFTESLKTNVFTSFNLRSFATFYKLRSDSHAMKEIQVLANEMFSDLDEFTQELVDKINK